MSLGPSNAVHAPAPLPVNENALPVLFPPMTNLNDTNHQERLQQRQMNIAGGNVASKTPLSVLQGLLSCCGTVPNYELVQVQMDGAMLTFCYRVTVAEVTAVGSAGRSKKEAKHAAAKAMLDKLVGHMSEGGTLPGDGVSTSIHDTIILCNPIESLQEMCISCRWPPPLYDVESQKGLIPSERFFTVKCKLFDNSETGSGKKMKLAKRQAALKMWLKLKDNMPVKQPDGIGGLQHDHDVIAQGSSASTYYSELKDTEISTLTPRHSRKVYQFYKSLKSSTDPRLSELQNVSLAEDIDFIKLLQDIAYQQQFEITFVEIEEKAMSGAVQCLVQLAPLPVAVCHGSGLTSKDAQIAAARTALEYLKIMTKE